MIAFLAGLTFGAVASLVGVAVYLRAATSPRSTRLPLVASTDVAAVMRRGT